MNPAEQHAHRTVTAKLETRIVILEKLVDLQARALAQFLPATADELGGLRDQFTAIADQVTALHRWRIDTLFASVTLRQRLRWLLRGR